MLSPCDSKPKLWSSCLFFCFFVCFLFSFFYFYKKPYIGFIDHCDSFQSTALSLKPKASTNHERHWWNFVLMGHCVLHIFTRHWAMTAIHRGSQMKTKCRIQTLQVVILLLRSSMECPHWKGTVGCNPKTRGLHYSQILGLPVWLHEPSRNGCYSERNNLSRIVV